ncbi:MAG TPA: fumarylacetoacetate hydrolase family protein [Steroidobacteraceae bacterium]
MDEREAAAASDLRRAGEMLASALRDRKACDAVRSLVEPHGLEGAYFVQRTLEANAIAAGQRITGRKIGLTAPAVQTQLGVSQPDFGFLTDGMELGDGDEIPFTHLIAPRVEAEIAFVLGSDLTADTLSLGVVINAVAYALPAIEIVDSRVRDWKISIFDTVADNASAGMFVLGGTPRKIDAFDLRLCGMSLECQGEPVSVGCGAACLGNPLNAVLWLARTMQRHGRPLRAGQIVLSGALGAMVPVSPGAAYTARISGLGSVTANFSRS